MEIKDFQGNPTNCYWDKNRLCADIKKDCGIHSCLAEIKSKNDGRWEYFIKKQRHFFEHLELPNKKQGVFATREECCQYLEKIFNVR
jgi:hypothetical protein